MDKICDAMLGLNQVSKIKVNHVRIENPVKHFARSLVGKVIMKHDELIQQERQFVKSSDYIVEVDHRCDSMKYVSNTDNSELSMLYRDNYNYMLGCTHDILYLNLHRLARRNEWEPVVSHKCNTLIVDIAGMSDYNKLDEYQSRALGYSDTHRMDKDMMKIYDELLKIHEWKECNFNIPGFTYERLIVVNIRTYIHDKTRSLRTVLEDIKMIQDMRDSYESKHEDEIEELNVKNAMLTKKLAHEIDNYRICGNENIRLTRQLITMKPLAYLDQIESGIKLTRAFTTYPWSSWWRTEYVAMKQMN